MGWGKSGHGDYSQKAIWYSSDSETNSFIYILPPVKEEVSNDSPHFLPTVIVCEFIVVIFLIYIKKDILILVSCNVDKLIGYFENGGGVNNYSGIRCKMAHMVGLPLTYIGTMTNNRGNQ